LAAATVSKAAVAASRNRIGMSRPLSAYTIRTRR
jgi:hypothetical protein